MTQKFDAIAIFGAMRSGSNLLERSLGLHPKIEIYGEIFNPNFIGEITQDELAGFSVATRDEDPLGFLRKIHEKAAPRLPCFRIFQDHHPKAQDEILRDPRIAKLILQRNPVDSFVSLLIARETDQWLLARKKMQSLEAKVNLDLEAYDIYQNKLQKFYDHISEILTETSQDYFFVNYAEIKSLRTLNKAFDFVGIAPPLTRYDEPIRRQNPHPVAYYLQNPEMLDALGYVPEDGPVADAQPPVVKQAELADTLHIALLNIEGTRDQHELFHLRKANGGTLGALSFEDAQAWQAESPESRFIYARPVHPVLRLYRAFRLAALSPDEFCETTNDSAKLHDYVNQRYGADLVKAFAQDTSLQKHKQNFKKFLFFMRDGLWKNAEIRVRPAFLPQSILIDEWQAITDVKILKTDESIGAFSAPPRKSIPSKFPLQDIVDDTIIERSKAIYADDYARFEFPDNVEGFIANYP